MKQFIYCLILLSAFFASAIEAQTISVSPSSGIQFQTFELTIRGDSTNFKSPNVGIVFYMDAADTFSATPNLISSDTKMSSYVTIPGIATPGVYDVRVINTVTDSIYYFATASFLVNPGDQPYITILPDSGAAGTNFSVTIDGSNTFFNAEANNSDLFKIALDLIAFDSVYYSAHPTMITSDSEMTVLFNLPDSLHAGLYIARLHTLGVQPSFDDSQYFFVKSAPVITLPNTKSWRAGSTVSIDVLVQGSPIPEPNTQVFLFPAGSRVTQTQADSLILTSDSTFTAVFALPLTLIPGLYDIVILAFGDLTLTGKALFTVEPFSGVDIFSMATIGLEVYPNPADRNVDFSFSLPKAIQTRLVLFDALGRTIATLYDGIMSGPQNIEWNSDNVSAGSYFYELAVGDGVYRGRVVVQH